MKPMKAVSALIVGSALGLLSASSAGQNLGDVRDAARGVGSAVTNPGRSAECAKGDTKVVRKIAKETVEHGRAKFKIGTSLYDGADVARAEREMYDFLNWKLGSPSAVCAQYVTAGVKHFEKGYSDEAAAALMGLELPGAGRTEFKLPKRVSEQLKALIKNCADQAVSALKGGANQPAANPAAAQKVSAQALEKVSDACHQQVARLRQQLEKNYGIVAVHLQDAAIKKIGEAALAGTKAVDRIGFNMPKSWDVETSAVQKLIAERQAEKGTR